MIKWPWVSRKKYEAIKRDREEWEAIYDLAIKWRTRWIKRLVEEKNELRAELSKYQRPRDERERFTK